MLGDRAVVPNMTGHAGIVAEGHRCEHMLQPVACSCRAFEPAVPAAGPESVTEQRAQRTYLDYPAKRDVTSHKCNHIYAGSLRLHAVAKYAHLLAVEPG
jgi:hypothetical protein